MGLIQIGDEVYEPGADDTPNRYIVEDFTIGRRGFLDSTVAALGFRNAYSPRPKKVMAHLRLTHPAGLDIRLCIPVNDLEKV